jgi:hypothetical protein
MGKASPHRAAAEAAVKLASKSDDSEFKAIMLNIAQDWLDLAQFDEEREAKNSPRRKPGNRRRA